MSIEKVKSNINKLLDGMRETTKLSKDIVSLKETESTLIGELAKWQQSSKQRPIPRETHLSYTDLLNKCDTLLEKYQ